MAGFREGNSVVHGLAVADFANQDNIRCLAQGVFQRNRPIFGIYADFSLGDDAVFVLVDKLNRVFDGDNVVEAVFVSIVDKGGERSGLARTCTTDKNNQAAFSEGDVFQNRGQIKRFKFRYIAGNGAEHQCSCTALNHGIDTEAAGIGQADGEVAFVGGRKFFDLFGRHNRKSDFHTFFSTQRLITQSRNFAVHFHGWREIGGNEKVGAFVCVHMV